jgi:hypothetical protein
MNSWQEFLKYLDEPSDTEYGDFKRRTDAHLRHLVETSPPMNEKQAHEIAELRDELLWHDHADVAIDSIKNYLRRRIMEISTLH